MSQYVAQGSMARSGSLSALPVTPITAQASIYQVAAPSSRGPIISMPTNIAAPLISTTQPISTAMVSMPAAAPPLSPMSDVRMTAAGVAAGAAPGRMVPCDEWQPPVAAPVSLTQGLPDPQMVQKQKEGYVRSLDEALRQGSTQLDMQCKQQRDLMRQQAADQIKQFEERVDQQVRMQEMDLDQQFLHVLQCVRQQATKQRAQLETQALQLSFEYQQKKVEEDMLAHQFELTKQQQALKNQMVSQGPISPLPSYIPAASSDQSPMLGVSKVNSYMPPGVPAASVSYPAQPTTTSYSQLPSYTTPLMPGTTTMQATTVPATTTMPMPVTTTYATAAPTSPMIVARGGTPTAITPTTSYVPAPGAKAANVYAKAVTTAVTS